MASHLRHVFELILGLLLPEKIQTACDLHLSSMVENVHREEKQLEDTPEQEVVSLGEPDEGYDERGVEDEHQGEHQGLVEVVDFDEGGQGDDAHDPDVHQEVDAARPVGGQRVGLGKVGGVGEEGGGGGAGDPYNRAFTIPLSL